MSVLDIFKSSLFDMASLTIALDKLPRFPGRIGAMNLFKDKPIKTTSAIIEERHGKLALLNTAARGTVGETSSKPGRVGRSFLVPHIPHNDVVLADEVQDVRAFGSETDLETIAQTVNDKLASMKANHETTWEYHRAGAIKGVVLDADGSTINNWYTEFGITEEVVAFALATSTTNIKGKATEVLRHIRDNMGGSNYTGVHALCGNTFFDLFINHTEVKAAYERWQSGQFLRDQQFETPFLFAGITWENYDLTIGSKPFMVISDARFFPVGSQDVFVRANAPANFVETVNTMGRPIYAKQERQKFDTGIDLHTQSNPLHICTRPGALVKGTVA